MPRLFLSDKRKAIISNIGHLLVGLFIIMEGIGKAEHSKEFSPSVILMFAAGAFIIFGAVFHHKIARKVPNFPGLFHIAEGISLIIGGFILLGDSPRMPYFLFFLGLCYVGTGIFDFITDAEEKKKLRPRFLAVLGTTFLAAAALAAAFNLRGSNDAWVNIMAGLLVVVGGFLLFLRRRLPKS